MAAGIVKRHSKLCRGRDGQGCNCIVSYEAWVYSPRDDKKIGGRSRATPRRGLGEPMPSASSTRVPSVPRLNRASARRRRPGFRGRSAARSVTDPERPTSRQRCAGIARRSRSGCCR